MRTSSCMLTKCGFRDRGKVSKSIGSCGPTSPPAPDRRESGLKPSLHWRRRLRRVQMKLKSRPRGVDGLRGRVGCVFGVQSLGVRDPNSPEPGKAADGPPDWHKRSVKSRGAHGQGRRHQCPPMASPVAMWGAMGSRR